MGRRHRPDSFVYWEVNLQHHAVASVSRPSRRLLHQHQKDFNFLFKENNEWHKKKLMFILQQQGFAYSLSS